MKWTPEERERQARAAKAMIEIVQGPDRLSRIEARFEKMVEYVGPIEGRDNRKIRLNGLWTMAQAVESFLESKRAEVKDGK